MAPTAGPAPAPKLPPVPHVEVRKEIAPVVPDAPPPPVRVYKSRKGLVIGLSAAAAVVVISGGLLAWNFLSTPEPEPAPAKRPPTASPAKSEGPAKAGAPAAQTVTVPAATPPAPSAGNAIAAAPAQAVNRAEQAAGAQGGRVTATNEVADADRPANTPATAPRTTRPAATTPAPNTPAATTRMTELAPGVSAAVRTEASVEASAAFRTYVGNLRVSGVVGGANPKALINGRLVQRGDVLDSGLGVSFEGVNGNQLVFKDRNGATVLRKY